MDVEKYDVIIVGGGALGLSAAYHCTLCPQYFKKILVLEQFPFLNQRGSSTGDCRMFRVMYSEEFYAELACETLPMWEDLAMRFGIDKEMLIYPSGLLMFGVDTPYTPEGSLMLTKATMNKLKIPYTELDSKELQQQYPFRNLPDNYYGLFQKDRCGTINVPATLKGLHKLSKDAGVNLHDLEQVMRIEPGQTGGMIRVYTNLNRTYQASKLILCPGAFANQVLKALGIQLNLKIWEMSFAYYQMRNPSKAYPMWFQFDFPPASGGARLFYGFPSVPWGPKGYVKVAVDFASRVMSSPDQRTFVPAAEDIHPTMNYIQEHLQCVDTEPTHMATCLVPLVEDNGFILDFAPKSVSNHENILICTAGWAFKFTPMFGLILSQLAVGTKPKQVICSMSINRDGVLVGSPPAAATRIRLRHGHPALTAR